MIAFVFAGTQYSHGMGHSKSLEVTALSKERHSYRNQ